MDVIGVETLVSLGINLVAIDFDLTLISKHTGGRWPGGPEGLVIYIRPIFHRLLPLLIEKDIMISIVTFSPQRALIEKVLQLAFPDFASQIILRARDNTWGHPGDASKDGKQKFMASAAEVFERDRKVVITRNTTLLIDDDPTNIQIALDKGVRALWFIPEDPDSLIAQLNGLV